jgi:hypothetical protein
MERLIEDFAMNSTGQWYYATADEPLGPLSEPQIKKLAASGRLEPFHRVWTKGMAEWQPAGSVAVLKGSEAIPSDSPAAQEWYYGSGGKKQGPVSFARLRQLVIGGKIEASDRLWTDAWDDWKRASDVRELRQALLPPVADPDIPMPALEKSGTSVEPAATAKPSAPDIPSIPSLSSETQPIMTSANQEAPSPHDPIVSGNAKKQDFGTTAKTWLSGLLNNTKAAGRLVAKQTERTKLANVTLPAAYRELGRHVYPNGQFREEFSTEFQSIDDLERKLQEVEASAKQSGQPQGAGGKAKALAGSAKAAANRKVLEQKRGQAFAALGKAVFEKHGQQAGPEELVGQVANLRSRLELLDSEIAELSQAGQGQVVTPKRIAIGGIAVAALLLLLVLKSLFLPARPVYAHLEDDYRGMYESHKTRLMEEHGVDDLDQVPKSANKAAFEKLKQEVNTLFADTEPPPITIDEGAAGILGDISISPPKFDSFILGHYWTFPLKFTAKSRIDQYDTELTYKIYAPDDTVIDDGNIIFDTDGMPGEQLSGRLDAIDADSFFKAHHFRIFPK